MRQTELRYLLASNFNLGMERESCSLQIVRTHLSTQVILVSFVELNCTALPLERYRRNCGPSSAAQVK